MSHHSQLQRLHNNFANSKNQCLGKRDKSSAGRIDPKAVEICALINAIPALYTTSSCAGRCFLYTGPGTKNHAFRRYRVSHDTIHDAKRYFDLETLDSDPTGGGDPIPTIGREDFKEGGEAMQDETYVPNDSSNDSSIWLRFEPFILHVACRSMEAASQLMNIARPAFKNVGLTTWKDSRFLVAIWGDEGLDAPVVTGGGTNLVRDNEEWYTNQINIRHERNWEKIARFVEAMRSVDESDFDEGELVAAEDNYESIPKSFDVVGDVAILHDPDQTKTDAEWQAIGESIRKKNKGIKVVAVRQSTLAGTQRAVGDLKIVSGIQRDPLITSHTEYNIKCVVDLNRTFFSPRMAQERLRICQQVARGEHILVLFAGVAMEALQIACRTEAASVVTVELNEVAVECSRRSRQFLPRNKSVKCPGAEDRLDIRQGDVLELLPTLPRNHFHRIFVPRPKEGATDGDLGTGENGKDFLDALLPTLLQEGGECHWYDFAADHELPECSRTKQFLASTCEAHGLKATFLHVAKVGSVAMHQLRVCVDFRVNQA